MNIDKKSLLLEDDRLYLRPLTPGDVTDEYVNGLNDPEVNRYLVNVRQNVQTRDLVEKYVISNMESDSCILFGIFIRNGQKSFIGTIRAHEIDFYHYSATVGICVFNRQAWKKGYALRALELVKDYFFGILSLHYIEAGVYKKNTNSINLFIRAGFVEWFRVKDKFRLVDSFEEAIYFAAINPLFNTSFLRLPRLAKNI